MRKLTASEARTAEAVAAAIMNDAADMARDDNVRLADAVCTILVAYISALSATETLPDPRNVDGVLNDGICGPS